MTKREIDKEVAGVLGIRYQEVALITATFLRLASMTIVRRGELDLYGFGGFLRKGLVVRFKKSRRLKSMLKEISMDKLGVDEGTDQAVMEKAATEGCPECGAKVEKHGNTLVCPNHGTAPFEKKSSK